MPPAGTCRAILSLELHDVEAQAVCFTQGHSKCDWSMIARDFSKFVDLDASRYHGLLTPSSRQE